MFQAGGAQEGANIKNKADAEIDRILAEQYERGMTLLTENRDILDQIAKVLIEKEKINGVQLLDLIKEIRPNILPEGAMDAVKAVVAAAKPKPVEPELAPVTGA